MGLFDMTERRYNDGDVIFLDGDPIDATYVVVSGNVELSKSSEKGRIRQALLKAGESFGDGEASGRGVRGATARAVGKVTVEMLPPGQRPTPQGAPPRARPSFFAGLARLFGASGTPPPPPAGGSSAEAALAQPRPGLFQRLFGGGSRLEHIEIRVARITCDFGETSIDCTRHVTAALEKRKGVRARPLNKDLGVDFTRYPEEQSETAAANGRRLLAAAGADLLIWGEVPPPGTTLHLRFVSKIAAREDRAGAFLPSSTLNLPVDFGPELAPLLLAVVLAATEPASEGKALRLKQTLPDALYAAMPGAQNLPVEVTSRERAAIQMCYGNALSIAAQQRNSAEHFQLAARAYKTALESLSRDDTPDDWAIVHMRLGEVYQALADIKADTKTLDAAIDAFTRALKVLTKLNHPLLWAATQNRLGLMLHKLDMRTGDTEMVKHSLSAFQSALKVYTRKDTPMIWAEVMNNFAQAAQVLGEQLRNPEVLEKAAEACRSALEVRKKEKTPMLWAATQNNLGSALFLLGKQTGEAAHLEGAAEAFENARDCYTAFGAGKLAAITEKNLSHVKRRLEKNAANAAPKGIPRMQWEQEKSKASGRPQMPKKDPKGGG